MTAKRGPMPTVTYDGQIYGLKSRATVVPDLLTMDSLEARLWLLRNTRARGFSTAVNPLRGMGAVLTVKS